MMCANFWCSVNHIRAPVIRMGEYYSRVVAERIPVWKEMPITYSQYQALFLSVLLCVYETFCGFVSKSQLFKYFLVQHNV